MVENTARKMAEGGLYDQIGGGFHRYSTDARWLVPHFEKMLYDNAQLARVYLHLYQATENGFYRTIAEETLAYVLREMTDKSGGFYSTQDADSEGHEGKFFVWSVEELKDILGEEDAKVISDYFGVTAAGNFEGKNILNVVSSAQEIAARHGLTASQFEEILARSRQSLFSAREKRIKPGRDEKILTAWSGMMITAFAEASVVLQNSHYRETAVRGANFVLQNLQRGGLLLRTSKDGDARLNGYLEDYAFFGEALFTLYEVTGDSSWIKECRNLVDKMIEEFWDDAEGGFFFTGKSHEQLIIRSKDYFDNATPSGNSVAAELLLKMAALLGDDSLRRKAVTIFRLLREPLGSYPSAFGRMLGALDLYLSAAKEVVIVGDPASDDTQALTAEIWKRYLPNKVVGPWNGVDQLALDLIPLLKDRTAIAGRPTVYVCENFTCKQPVNTVSDLRRQLSATE
jgi:uncharacterized protein YyaL (SSP411 family)